jgi:SNF2 family DNA or RNA helicase
VIVLHSAWLSRTQRLALWAEDGGRLRGDEPRSSRSHRRRRAERHPFAASADGIRFAATDVGGIETRDVIAKGREEEILLTLPAAQGGPVCSPPLEDELPPAPTTTPSPSPSSPVRWIAPAVTLEAPAAADLALALASAGPVDAASDVTSVVLACDLRFAVRCAELILELAARGRMFPTLDRSTSGWCSAWRPLVDRTDRGRIELLRWALPLSFMSADITDEFANADHEHAGDFEEARDEVLRSYLWTVADALVRRLVADRVVPDTHPEPSRHSATNPGVVDAWLAALRSTDGVVEAPDDELRELHDRLQAWHATRDDQADPVRTCFRIVPPPDDADRPGSDEDTVRPGPGRRPTAADPSFGEEWRIEFALQALDDPSLLVSAESVWADGPELTALARHATHPDEHLLRGLGRAARLVPSIGPALASATPSAQVTDATGALAFLRDGAPILEAAGFGVLAPPWWRSSRARVSLRLKARTSAARADANTAIGLDGLCDIRWEAVLGTDKLELSELRALARLKQPLVRVRGQWVELREGDIAAAIAAVGAKGPDATRMSARAVMQAALETEPGYGELPVAGVEATGWLGDLLAGADDRRLELRPTPGGFAGRLRPYQERGLGWLAFLGDLGLGACLADDMGLGKTAQLLALLVDERGRAKRRKGLSGPVRSAGPTLVLCPMSLLGNWQRETERFAPTISVYVHHGPSRLDGNAFARHARQTDLVLSTYGLAGRDQQLFAGFRWSRLVLDEAQQIKNSAARTTQSVRAIPAERRIAMTGTPVENRLSELWSIMHFLNPGLLGSERGFRERFAIPIERDGDDDAAVRLRRITGPFILRRLKTDRSIIADLPDKLEMKEFCTLTREQASLYQAVIDDMLVRIDEAEGIERRGLVLATMMKLKQVCNHPAHFLGDGSSLAGRSGKLTRLVEVLEEAVGEGDRALVFTQFTEMGTLIERHLRRRLGFEVLWLHGKVPKKARDAMVERFQRADGPPVFVLSLKAGGTGLNLTGATHVVHYDRWWNPAVENQATDRAFRIGQARRVQVRKFVCGGTLEERIDTMIEQKRAIAERIVGSGEGWITEMSTAQLRDVVALSADAVGDD